MERIFIDNNKLRLSNNCCQRTQNRFLKFKDEDYLIEILKNQINQTLFGDGFVIGEPMTLFRISIMRDSLLSCAWEGWIPDSEFIILEETK